jgi:LemA protein
MEITTIIYIAIAIAALWAVLAYNGLVRAHYRVKEALSDIDVQLKRRYDLIPNLVETVKGYMGHEQKTLESLTAARASVARGGSPLERDAAEHALSSTLKSLFAVAENYPDLKANTNFLELQRELSDTENKIQAARRFYNSVAMDMNSRVDSFPTKLIADLFGFKDEKFFETETAAERQNVRVRF